MTTIKPASTVLALLVSACAIGADGYTDNARLTTGGDGGNQAGGGSEASSSASGQTGSGGENPTHPGGAAAGGDSSGAGGTTSSGGDGGTGGTDATGGDTGTGGIGTGGTVATGGSPSTGGTSGTAGACSDEFFDESSGRRYLLRTSQLGWAAARSACQQWGGDLASVGSATENTIVGDLISCAGFAAAYIGLNDIDEEGVFVWSTGEPLSYSNWNLGSPHSDGENRDCVILLTTQGNRWSDEPCDVGRRHVCARTE
jgi:hypothetical protein